MIIPGKVIVVNECMKAWRGVEMYLNDGKGPHVTKIIRKPEGVGFEMKSSADGHSGVLLMLQLQDSKENRQVTDVPHHSQLVLDLTKPWPSQRRTILGDSAFSSVRTAEEIIRQGNHFIGIVKTATKGFPKQIFSAWS